MASFAPNNKAQAFLLQQQKEEDLHLELLTNYVGEHPRPDVLISPHLKKLDTIMAQAIQKRDYVECIFIQNFIVEGLNISLLRELEHHTDGYLSELSGIILKDEIHHMEFGVTELQRILRENKDPLVVRKLLRLQRKTLFYATRLAITLAREAHHLGIPVREFSEKTVNEHFERIRQAEFPLPWSDIVLYKGIRMFLKLI